jgi:hypothetical protein
MSSLRKALIALAVGTLGAVGLLVPAAPAAAASSGCDFTMDSLKARNLDNDGGLDYAWLYVDTTWFPAGNNGVSFGLGTTHSPILFGNPYMGFGSGGLRVELVLDTLPWNTSVGVFTVACNPGSNKVHTFNDGDAIYDLTYDVT